MITKGIKISLSLDFKILLIVSKIVISRVKKHLNALLIKLSRFK